MKKSYPDHVGNPILLFDGAKGIVRKVRDKSYTISHPDNTESIVPIGKIRLRGGELSLKQEKDHILGNIYQLQHCGERLNGTVVKVVAYRQSTDDFLFNYTTGFGSFAPIKCFKPITTINGIIRLDDTETVCDICAAKSTHTDTKLYFIRLADGIKQGGMCPNCFNIAKPLFNIEPVEEKAKPQGEKTIISLDTDSIIRLNKRVLHLVSEITDLFGLDVDEKHLQVGKNTMEYVLKFNIPTPVVKDKPSKVEMPMNRLKELLSKAKDRRNK